MVWGVEWLSSCKCNLERICKTFGSCLITWSVLLVGQLWLVMCTILLIVKWWPLQFVTCSLKTPKLNRSCGQSLMKPCWSMSFQNQNLKDSCLIMHKPIGTLLELSMVLGTFLSRWLIRNVPIYSIGLNRSINTANNWLNLNCKINTMFYATNTRMQNPLWRSTISML